MDAKFQLLTVLCTMLVGSGLVTAGTFDNVTTVISDTIPIFGAISNLVIGIFPIMIILGILGFILGIFDAILGTVTSKMGGL